MVLCSKLHSDTHEASLNSELNWAECVAEMKHVSKESGREQFNEKFDRFFLRTHGSSTENSLHWGRSSVYWLLKTSENPAYLDLLKSELLTKNAMIHMEARSFWRLKIRSRRYSNKEDFWYSIFKDPNFFNTLNPRIKFSAEELVEVFQFIDLHSSPTKKIDESLVFIKSMMEIPVKIDGKFVSINILNVDHVIFTELAENAFFLMQIRRTKSHLPSINPLYLNTLRTIGICHESLLTNNYSDFQKYRQLLEKDIAFTNQVFSIIKTNNSL